MPTIQLQTPVWVRHVDQAYHLSPLLFEGPEGVDARYEKAQRKFRTHLVKHFRQDYKLQRENLPDVLWYLFQPEYQFQPLNLSFRYGNRSFQGSIAVGWFTALGGTVVLLPAFDRHMFVLPGEAPSRSELAQAVERQLQKLARTHRKQEGQELDFESRKATRGEHVALVEQAVFVQEEKISFQSEAERFFFQLMRADTAFEGRLEVHRVGHALNGLYPDELQRAYRREALVQTLGQMLFNHENVPVVLLGPRKAGKTTVLHEVVYRYLAPEKQEAMHERDHVWYLDPTRLIAGMSVVGAWQRRLESIIAFVRKPLEKGDQTRRDVLYFDNVMALFRVGKSAQNDMTLSDLLKPYLQKRTLQVVLETTPDTWDAVSEIDRSFTDLFQVIRLYDPGEADTLRIVSKLRADLEDSHQFSMENNALLRLITLQRRYSSEESLIGRSADTLHQLATRYRKSEVSVEMVQRAFNQKTHLNPELTREDVVLYQTDLQRHFQARLVGQPQVVDALCQLVQQIKAHLYNPQRPYGSFLFIGPTGVGKTEAAKVLASFLFTHPEALLRFDMNEYIDAGATTRLVGDAYSPEGQLTSKVRHNPFCVLLFDEIEKAHPDIHNLLLQVLDEGRLTDALGQVANFCNTVIVMTSNLGANRVGKSISFQTQTDEMAHTYQKAVRDFFRPEFINRIGQTLIFRPLEQADIERIAHLQIQRLFTRQGFTRRKVMLSVHPAVLNHLAGQGFDPSMGGRALKRQIDKDLVGLLADRLVDMPPSHPLLVDLLMRDDRIEVNMTALRESERASAPPLPTLQAEGRARVSHFERLLERAERLRTEVEAESDAQEEESEVDLLTALREEGELAFLFSLKEDIRDLCQDLHEQVRQFGLRGNLVLRSGHFQIKTLNQKDSYLDNQQDGDRRVKLDQANREAVEDYLEEVNQAGETLVQEGHSLYLYQSVQLSQLQASLDAYRAKGIEHVLLRLRARGGAKLDHLCFLAWWLHQFCPTAGVPHRGHESDHQLFLLSKGVGLQQRLEPLLGFHLLRETWQLSPQEAPVQVDMVSLTPEAWAELAETGLPPQPETGIFPRWPQPSIPENWPDWERRVVWRHTIKDLPLPPAFLEDWGRAPRGLKGVSQDLRLQWVLNLPPRQEDLNLTIFANLDPAWQTE
jgi:ATP-dependent Clp protease ATP-binding subunit ClpC